jgi:NADH:ubiquinone oxidoreductase subunit F (NADH-binding)
MFVIDEGTCMVDVARIFLLTPEGILREMSLLPNRSQRMLEILTRICEGTGRWRTLKREGTRPAIKDVSLCGLGPDAPNPV